MNVKSVLLIVLLYGAASCVTPKKSNEVNTIVNYNVTIAPDFSSRINSIIYPKPISDEEVVKSIVDNIYPKILKNGREMDQMDKFSIDFINKQLINYYNVNTRLFNIDFSAFKNQEIRINYILRDTSAKNLKTDKANFISEFERVHKLASTNTFGADIWTYLNEGIDNKVVNNEIEAYEFANGKYANKFRNILILITDGYIEAGIYGQGYDISVNRVNQFRQAYLNSGEKNLKQFFDKRKDFRIKPVNNPLLKNLEILVVELYDRSETNQGASIHPTDMEIIKLFWADWFDQSGVTTYKLLPKFSTKAEAEKAILDFMGVK